MLTQNFLSVREIFLLGTVAEKIEFKNYFLALTTLISENCDIENLLLIAE